MDLEPMLKLAGAALTGVGGPAVLSKILRAIFPNAATKLHQDIQRKLDLLDRIPTTSAAHPLMLAAIEHQVKELLTTATKARRDPFGIALGVMFVAGAVAAGFSARQVDAPWSVLLWFGCAFLALFGVVGLVEDSKSAIRDEKGRIIANGPSGKDAKADARTHDHS